MKSFATERLAPADTVKVPVPALASVKAPAINSLALPVTVKVPVDFSWSATVTSFAAASRIAPFWTVAVPVPASPIFISPAPIVSAVSASDTVSVPLPVASTPSEIPPSARTETP